MTWGYNRRASQVCRSTPGQLFRPHQLGSSSGNNGWQHRYRAPTGRHPLEQRSKFLSSFLSKVREQIRVTFYHSRHAMLPHSFDQGANVEIPFQVSCSIHLKTPIAGGKLSSPAGGMQAGLHVECFCIHSIKVKHYLSLFHVTRGTPGTHAAHVTHVTSGVLC